MKIRKEYTLKRIEDVTFLVKKENGRENLHPVFTVNETGIFLCRALMEEKTERELLAMLEDEYDFAEEDIPRVRADIGDFLQKMRLYGVLDEG